MTTPALGRAVRDEWMLDWNWLHVNHGSFGAAPRTVLEIQQDWRRRMEAEPSGFVFRILPEALRAQAESLGTFIGARGKDIVFVENATAGCNAVLRSLRLALGDEILVLSHGYPAVRNAVRYVIERSGARMTEAAVPFPRPHPAAIVAAVGAALTRRTRVAVIDHITSPSALVLPIAEITTLCHSAGVPVLVDGAHAPGTGSARSPRYWRRLVYRQLPQMAVCAQGLRISLGSTRAANRSAPGDDFARVRQRLYCRVRLDRDRRPYRVSVCDRGDRIPSTSRRHRVDGV
jgi:selenocysteine lyase/cysteine desulfurase